MAKETIIKYVLSALLLLFIVFLLEVTIFNYRHWQSVNNEPVSAEYTAGADFSQEDVNAFRVIGENPYIEVDGLDMYVENIALDLIYPEKGVTAVERIDYHLEVVDEGNSIMYSLPSMDFMHLVPQSHFDYLDLYGKAKTIRVCLDNLEEGSLIRIEYLVLNSQVPLMLSKKRMLFLFALFFILFLLRRNSFLHNIKAGEKSKIKTLSIIALLVMEIAFTYWGIHLNQFFSDPKTDSEKQFMYLAEALSQGETHLLIDPPPALKELSDPYDYANRVAACEGQSNLLWDTAFHDGKYYVYFGVAPVVLFYLPYYLVTGTHISTVTVVFINAVFVLIGVALLLDEIVKRWFSKLPLSMYLMFTSMFSFGAGLVFLLMKPDFYAVPLSMAMACCFLGLYFWLHSIKENKIDIPCIAAGSLLMALEAAVRPQFLLASFLCVLLFWSAIFKKRTLFSRKSIGATLGFIVPYVVVAALVMVYNFDRFGSPFDFGASYNLTFNNMPYRGWHLDRILNGTIGFLFTPSSVTNRFPYIDVSTFITSYQGPSADEPLFGGLIYNSFYLLPTLIPFCFKKIISDKRIRLYTYLAPVCALVVMIADSNMAGVLVRYNCDFAWYLMISAFLIMGMGYNAALSHGKNGVAEKGIYTALYICFVIFVLRTFLCQFAGESIPRENAKLAWHTVKHLAEFWH